MWTLRLPEQAEEVDDEASTNDASGDAIQGLLDAEGFRTQTTPAHCNFFLVVVVVIVL